MPDIGFGEIVTIVVIALLVFGPDRLPKMAADAGRTLRQVRQMAANARADLVDAAGLEKDPELSETMRDLRDLDPRRGLSGLLADKPTQARPASSSRGLAEGTSSARPGAAAGGSAPGTAAGATGTGAAAGSAAPDRDHFGTSGEAGTAGTPAPKGGAPSDGAAPIAAPVIAPVPTVDPDWT